MKTELIGDVQDILPDRDRLILKTAIAEVRIQIYSASIIRINVTRTPLLSDTSFAVIQNASNGLMYTETGDTLEICTDALKLIVSKKPLRFSFFSTDGRLLSEDDKRFGINWQGDRVTTYRKLYPDEKFIGLGEKTGHLDRRGSSYVNWNTDAALHDLKTDPLYKTLPFFIGLHNDVCYGLFFDNTHKSYFDFGATTDDQMSWFGADGGDMNYYFFGAQSVPDLIKDYTWLTGRMEMPPLWSLGYQQCRWSYMSSDEVLKIAGTFREKHIPADVIYCDIDYMDQYKIFTWSPENFSDPKKMIAELNADGFHLVTIVDPGIKIEKGYKQYDEGIANDYFATYPDGEKYTANVWPGRCHFPDFFNEKVRDWWGRSFNALTDAGVEGFWNDMNEPAAWGQNIPPIVRFGEHYIPAVRNAYGLQMAKATYEGTRHLLDNKRPFVLTRAAYSGVQRYSAVWTGDNSAYDEHMLLGQRLVNSIGITGVAFTGVDIGGFTGNPTSELMVRWNSLGVYTPIFRNHAAIDTEYREPWVWGEENEKIIKKDIEHRYKILPYIYASLYQSQQSGIPLSRTLAVHYQHDENVFDTKFENQFMFGDSLLVAPVISTKTEISVYLPEGEWYRLNVNTPDFAGRAKKLTGTTEVTASAPLIDLPVFVKAGAIIPVQSVIQHTAEKGDGILQLHIWYGSNDSSFVYYEDDGLTYNYQKGEYYKRIISFSPENKTIVLGASEGDYVSKFNKIRLTMHGFELRSLNLKLNDQVCVFDENDQTVFGKINNDNRLMKISF